MIKLQLTCGLAIQFLDMCPMLGTWSYNHTPINIAYLCKIVQMWKQMLIPRTDDCDKYVK